MRELDPAEGVRAAAFFDAEAAVWEQEHGPASALAARFRAVTAVLEGLVSWFPAPPAVLDIGCATGAHLRALRPRLRLGVGVDLSPRMIAAARHAAEHAGEGLATPLHFLVADAAEADTAIGAQDALRGLRFDLVMMVGTLEHVTAPARALRSAAALLAPGTGRLVVISPHRHSLPFLCERLGLGRPPPSFPPVRHFTLRELVRCAQDAGLGLERVLPVAALAGEATGAPPGLLRALDRVRLGLPPLRHLGIFAAVFRPAATPSGPPRAPAA